MIKKILVPGFNASCSPKALKLGLDVAKQFGGAIECLHVHPNARELTRYTASLDVESAMFSSQIWEALVAGDKTCAKRSRQVFDAFCDREHLNVASSVQASWQEVDGNNRDQTIAAGRYSDLVVFARPPLPEDLTTNGVGDVLVECGRPLLLAPSDGCTNPLSTVVVAWKESAATVHAVTAAMPLLAKAQKIHVLGVAEGDEDERPILASAERFAEFLRGHGLSPQAGHVRAKDRNACDVLLEAANERLHAGLLVMGGYGHSRAREFIFGGFTRRVLHSAPLPVFLCH